MHRTLTALTALLMSASLAAAAPPCTGPLAKSCIKKLFACFKPKGTCVAELALSPTSVQTVQCWDNRARIQIDAVETGGTVEYRGARGKRCLKGLLVAEGESGAFVFKRGRRTWTVRSTEDDGLAITCPNGATETYTEADVAAQPPSCGGFSASTVCTLGDCP